MKKLACLLLLILTVKTHAQTTNDSLATIIFYRNGAHSGSAVSITLKDSLGTVIRLYNQSYFVYQCKPGDYRFSINGRKWNNVYIKAKAGRTYYYKASVYSGLWSLQYNVEEADSVIANRSLLKKPHMDMNKPILRPKNRIGIAVGAGFGFDKRVMGTNMNGDDVSLSFGGGVGIGGYIGRELTKYLDLEIAYRHFAGGFSPSVKDASMDFSRHIISITPAFIIPIDGGYARRLKLGFGADIYLGSKLEIDIPSIPATPLNPAVPGIKDTWKYGDAYGYHLSAIYEINPSQRWSFFMGGRYYAINYNFSSGTKYFPIDDFFVKPNGSGLDFVFGAGFHF